MTIGNKICGLKGNLESIEFSFVGFVTIGVIVKLVGVGKDVIGSECVEAAFVKTDIGEVTPIIVESGI